MKQAGPHVLVVGGGLSGLCSAFELSEYPDLKITLIESSSAWGGKIQADFNPQLQRFEEHSIRVMSSTYLSFFDIMARAGLMSWVSPALEYSFCGANLEEHMPLSRWQPLGLEDARELCRRFELRPRKLISLAWKSLQLSLGRPIHRQRARNQSFYDALNMQDYDATTRDFLLRWIGMLAGARPYSKALDVLDSFALMFIPRTRAPELPGPETGKSFVFNRPSGGYARALAAKLRARGVRLALETPLRSIQSKPGQGIWVECDHPDFQRQAVDAVLMCTPIEVSRSLGALDLQSSKPRCQWSLGVQFLLNELPERLIPFLRTPFNLCFSTPWDLVFQIQSSESCWPEVPFPEGSRYNLSVSGSSLHKKGELFQRSFMECTPEQVLHEYLYQMGFKGEQQRRVLCGRAGIDPYFMRFTKDWQRYAQRPEVEMGPLHESGHRWVNAAPIYVRNAQDPPIGHISPIPGVFVAGEGVQVPGPWQIPSMEQAAVSAKQASHALLGYLGQKSAVQLLTAKPALNPTLAALLTRLL